MHFYLILLVQKLFKIRILQRRKFQPLLQRLPHHHLHHHLKYNIRPLTTTPRCQRGLFRRKRSFASLVSTPHERFEPMEVDDQSEQKDFRAWTVRLVIGF